MSGKDLAGCCLAPFWVLVTFQMPLQVANFVLRSVTHKDGLWTLNGATAIHTDDVPSLLFNTTVLGSDFEVHIHKATAEEIVSAHAQVRLLSWLPSCVAV